MEKEPDQMLSELAATFMPTEAEFASLRTGMAFARITTRGREPIPYEDVFSDMASLEGDDYDRAEKSWA